MRTPNPALLLLAVTIGVPGVGDAQPAPATSPGPPAVAAAITKARAFIRDTMTGLGSPGASIAVMRAGRIVWSEGFGFADLEQHVAATAQTRFRVGSVSKALTSVLLGKLVEQGKLDLDRSIQTYLPSFSAKRWPITTRQLGGHLAGVRHYNTVQENFVTTHYTGVSDALAIFAADSLLFEPGTQYRYSSYGWNLISAVLERAGGEPFLQLMQREVFDAAELRHTVADQIDSIIPDRARWYTRARQGGGIINAGFTDNSYKWAGGGFLSTTEDLVEFGDALLRGRLLKPETVRLLWTSQKTRDGKETGYGIGWELKRDRTGRRVIGHSGGSVGGTAMLMLYPDDDLIIAVLVNSDATFVGATGTIADFFLTR